MGNDENRSNVLLLDAFGGLAGDMLLGALIDLGLDLRDLRAALETLDLPGWSLRVDSAMRREIGCTKATFELSGGTRGGDDEHAHRHLPEIVARIEGSGLPEAAKQGAARTFRLLAQAEAKVHRIEPDQVHFHEVGADDAILDICGVSFGLHALGVEGIGCLSPLPAGTGTIVCDHGELPVPAPAVVELLSESHTLVPGGHGEMITPTGAALLRSYADETLSSARRLFPVRAGYGAGTRSASVLRLMLARRDEGDDGRLHDVVVELDAHIDDCTGEQLAFLAERCFDAGALDVVHAPIVMKKGRPGTRVTVLVSPDLREPVVDAMFRHSSTLGLRERETRRRILERGLQRIASPWGPVSVKWAAGRPRPEYEDCARIAREHGLSLDEVQRQVTAMAHNVEPREDD